jgi:hypothetical protein
MKLTTSLFAVSFLSVVAAGWAQLDADAPTDGPAGKPTLRDVTLGGHALHVAIDHDRVPVGEKVHVRLAMTDLPRRGYDVRVSLLEQRGSPMARMMPPPRTVETKVVHLGPEATTLAFELAGRDAKADPIRTAGGVVRYTIAVTSARNGRNDAGGTAIPVFAYVPPAYQLTLDPPALADDGKPIDLAVHVKSLAAKPLTRIQINVSSSFIQAAGASTIATLAPGAEAVVHLHGKRVTTSAAPFVQVYGLAEYGGSAATLVKIDPTTGHATAEPTGSPLALVGSMPLTSRN